MRKVKPFHKIFSWQYNSIFIKKKKKSPHDVKPFKKKFSIKTCFPLILMPELFHTGILKMYLVFHNLLFIFFIKHVKPFKKKFFNKNVFPSNFDARIIPYRNIKNVFSISQPLIHFFHKTNNRIKNILPKNVVSLNFA